MCVGLIKLANGFSTSFIEGCNCFQSKLQKTLLKELSVASLQKIPKGPVSFYRLDAWFMSVKFSNIIYYLLLFIVYRLRLR